MRQSYTQLGAILWLAFSTFLFCLPGSTLPAAGWMSDLPVDKWVHVFIFLVMFYLWAKALKAHTGRSALLLFAGVIVYGGIIELVQDRWIPKRELDILDLVADGAGALLALVWLRYIKK